MVIDRGEGSVGEVEKDKGGMNGDGRRLDFYMGGEHTSIYMIYQYII